jgi:hypothetical protein
LLRLLGLISAAGLRAVSLVSFERQRSALGRGLLAGLVGGLVASWIMLVRHDDAKREYAYGPAQGLADSKVGTFTQALYDEAKKKGWAVASPQRPRSAAAVSASSRRRLQPEVRQFSLTGLALFAHGR